MKPAVSFMVHVTLMRGKEFTQCTLAYSPLKSGRNMSIGASSYSDNFDKQSYKSSLDIKKALLLCKKRLNDGALLSAPL